jgi:uncharacterized protein GlcG (DUF336 family)
MSNVTLEQAAIIVDKAIAKRHELGLAPLTVAVLDTGGHLVAFKREDKSSFLRPDIAIGKAWGCLGMGFSTRKLVDRFKGNPAFFGAIASLSDGRMLASPGGVLVRDKAGDIIGSVGISGDTGDNDEKCAIAGIEAAGLATGD